VVVSDSNSGPLLTDSVKSSTNRGGCTLGLGHTVTQSQIRSIYKVNTMYSTKNRTFVHTAKTHIRYIFLPYFTIRLYRIVALLERFPGPTESLTS
jgi:hypothetical protein